MACLSININPIQQASLHVTALATAFLYVTANQPELSVGGARQATLSVSEVCSVSLGDIVVLASTDGPLRTRDGGYILLDPATNPPDD